MTTGTKFIEATLEMIGAHSITNPAGAEALNRGMDVLNNLTAELDDDGYTLGAVPLKVVGSELSEPQSASYYLQCILATRLHTHFPGSQISETLTRDVRRGWRFLDRKFRPVTISPPVARETLVRGSGNKQSQRSQVFYSEGTEIG